MFHGGFDIFLWQPYTRPAESIYADIFYQNDAPIQVNPSRRVLAVVKETAVMNRFKTELNTIWAKIANSGDQLTPEFAAVLPILAMCELTVNDTMIFLKESLDEVNSLVSNNVPLQCGETLNIIIDLYRTQGSF